MATVGDLIRVKVLSSGLPIETEAVSTIRFFAYLSAEQSISVGAFDQVDFDTESIDDGGDNFNTSTHRWTAPRACSMNFAVMLEVDGHAAGDYYSIALYKNGAWHKAKRVQAPTANHEAFDFFIPAESVAQGDYFEVFLAAGGTGTRTVKSAAAKCWFSGFESQ